MACNNRFRLRLWNVISTDVGWFACILVAAGDIHWLGLLTVPILFAIHLAFFRKHPIRSVLITAAITMAIGFVVDTGLICIGAVEPNRRLMPAPLTPIWDVLIWANFSLSLNTSLHFLQRRPVWAAVFGAVLGPAAYLGASQLGALQIGSPVVGSMLWIAAAWLGVMPALALAARYVYPSESSDNSA